MPTISVPVIDRTAVPQAPAIAQGTVTIKLAAIRRKATVRRGPRFPT
jgi:hypothetical protein